MATEVRLPREGSTTMTSGVITEWLVAVGDAVVAGQPMVEVETDKVSVEIEAPVAGTVLALHADPDDEVDIGELLATLGDADEEVQTTEPAAPSPATDVVAPPVSSTDPSGDGAPSPAQPGEGPRAAPAARRRARELDIHLTTVDGSGPNGRITSADVEDAAAQGAAAGAGPAAPSASDGHAGENLLDGLRGHRHIVAERMGRASRETAAVTLFMRADVTALRAAEPEAAWSLADKVAAAVASALQAHPGLNATLTADGVVEHKRVGLGYAVDSPGGLVVPVVADAGSLALADLAQTRRRLVQAAQDGGLTIDDLAGGTFTLTNLGPLGIEHFTPIITPDQCGVLGIGAVSAGRLPLSLTFDHRIVDGAYAARFLKAVSDALAAVAHP